MPRRRKMAIVSMEEEKQPQQSVDDAHSDEVHHVIQEKVKVLKLQDEPLDFSSKKTSAGVADEGQTLCNHSATSMFRQTSLKTPREKESRDSDVSANGSRRRERSPDCWMTGEGGRLGGNASARPAEVHRPIEDRHQSKRTRHSMRLSKSVNRAREENHNEMSYSSCSPPEVPVYFHKRFNLYNRMVDSISATVNGGARRTNRTSNSSHPGQSMGQQPVLHHHMQRCPSSPTTADSTATPNMSNSVRQLSIDEGHNNSCAPLGQWLTLENSSFHHQEQQQQKELLQHVRKPAIENPGLRPYYAAFPGNYHSPRAFKAGFTFGCLQSSQEDRGERNEISPGTLKCSTTSCSPMAFLDNQTQPLVSSLFPSPSTAPNCTNNITAAAASLTDVLSRPTSNSRHSMDTMSSHSTTSSVVVNRCNSRPATPMTTVTTVMRSSQSRKRGRSVPDKLKDPEYLERRRKNNEAAKRSRDARRAKQDEIARRAAFLERENSELLVEVATLSRQNSELRYWLYGQTQSRL